MRNIHFAHLPSASNDGTEPRPTEPETPKLETRLRAVTNSPAQEYAGRPGAVERLPAAVCAMILSKSGRCRVERHQIKASVDGTERFYSSVESVTIAGENGSGRAVLWVANRRDPSVIHILKDDGSYVESIGVKGEADWFSQSETSKAAIAATRTHMRRDMDLLQELKQPDSDRAAADLAHNAAEVARVVQTFPAAEIARAKAVLGGNRSGGTTEGTAEFPKAEAHRAAVGNLAEQRDRAAVVKAETRSRVRKETGSLDDLMSAPPEEREPVGAEAGFDLSDLF